MEFYSVSLTTRAEDQAAIDAHSEDLAWDAAVFGAKQSGMELGSEDFVRVFDNLKERYADCAQAYGHLTYVAASMIRNLMDSGMCVIYPPDACVCDEHMRTQFEMLIGIVMSHVTSLYAIGPIGWLNNEEWEKLPEETRTVIFEVLRVSQEEMTKLTSGEDNDDNDRA